LRREAPVRTIPVPAQAAFGALALLATGAALARPPVATPDNLLDDRFTLQAGLVLSSNRTDIRSDASAGTVGTDVNAESLLGLPSKKLTGFGELMFRMKERHRIRMSDYWLPLDRHGTVVLRNTVDFKDTTYNTGDTVASSLKVRSFALTYTYSFIKNSRAELGASLGVNVLSLDAQVAVPARLRTEYAEDSAPAPLGGLDGTLRLSSRFYLEGRAQYIKGTISHVEASLKTFNGGLLYRWNPNFTLGLGYIGYSADVNSMQRGSSAHYSLSSKGPQLFARVGF
jgi:hypothetical protein